MLRVAGVRGIYVQGWCLLASYSYIYRARGSQLLATYVYNVRCAHSRLASWGASVRPFSLVSGRHVSGQTSEPFLQRSVSFSVHAWCMATYVKQFWLWVMTCVIMQDTCRQLFMCNLIKHFGTFHLLCGTLELASSDGYTISSEIVLLFKESSLSRSINAIITLCSLLATGEYIVSRFLLCSSTPKWEYGKRLRLNQASLYHHERTIVPLQLEVVERVKEC